MTIFKSKNLPFEMLGYILIYFIKNSLLVDMKNRLIQNMK